MRLRPRSPYPQMAEALRGVSEFARADKGIDPTSHILGYHESQQTQDIPSCIAALATSGGVQVDIGLAGGSFDSMGKLRTRDDFVAESFRDMQQEQHRIGKQIVARLDAGASTVASGLGQQTEQLRGIGSQLHQLSDEVLLLRGSLEHGMRSVEQGLHALEGWAELQARLLADVASSLQSPSSTQAKEFSKRAFSLLSRGLLDEARSEAGRSLAEEPYQWDAFYIIGQIEESSGEVGAALEHYEAAARYARGVSTTQEAMSLTAAARMHLLKGAAQQAEARAWDAYRLAGGPERLYASAVFLAAADLDGSRATELHQRLTEAVYAKPSLAVLAMAEPRIRAKQEIRDSALTQVRDTMAAQLTPMSSQMGSLAESLRAFAEYHNTQSNEQLHVWILTQAAPLYTKYRNRGDVAKWWWGDVAKQWDELVRSHTSMLPGFSDAEMRSLVDYSERMCVRLDSALEEGTLDSLHDARMSLPSELTTLAHRLEKLRDSVDQGCDRLQGTVASLEWAIDYARRSYDSEDTKSVPQKMISLTAVRLILECLNPNRTYFADTLQYVRNMHSEFGV